MRKNILRILVFALVLALLIPSMSNIGNEDIDEGDVVTALVMFPQVANTDKTIDFADHVNKMLVSYEGFILAELTERQRAALEARGAVIVVEENLHTIAIDGYNFDTRLDEPVIKERLELKPRSGVESHFLVQFVGPIKEEWLDTLRKMGADPISYYPYNAMLVEATPEVKTSLGTLEHVQWVGGYHPAYKIRPVLNQMDVWEEREVKIITHEPEGISSVLVTLDKKDVMLGYKGNDMGLVKARLTLDEIENVATLNEVSYIEPIYEMEADNSNMQWILQTNVNGNRRIWDEGILGTGQIVTYADTGLDYDHNMFREDVGTIAIGDIYNVTDPSRRKVIRYQPMAQWFVDNGIDRDGDGIPETEEDPNGDGILEAYSDSWPSGAMSGHGTLVSGTAAGKDDGIGGSSNDGGAKEAKIYFQDIGSVWQNPLYAGAWDDSLTWIPDDYYWLFIDSYKNGSRIHSNSWGARNSDYDLEAMMVDKFMWEHQDFLVLFSNGNGGPGSFEQYDVGSPATAKSTISVGSTRTTPSQNNIASYSSRGPTTDGRRKPTLSAVGQGWSSVSSGNPNDDSNTGYIGSWGGTSYAAPAASSLAAMIREYFEDGYYPNGVPLAGNEFYPSAALIKAMMMASGEMMTCTTYCDSRSELTYPNNSQGWGRPLLDNVMYFTGDTRKLLVVDNAGGLNTGQVVEYEFDATGTGVPLKFFLAWSDYPGAVGASLATVNNLNLQVEAPNGTTFWGNRFVTASGAGAWNYRGYTIPGGVPDSVNTDEGVIITIGNPQVDNWVTTGTWKVRVIAESVPAGPQPFGLVVIGDLNLDYGIVTIDRKVYSETDTINIEVRDSNALTAPVWVESTTEPGGELVNLIENIAGSGIWSGSIDTEFGLPAVDGKLQVKEGDTILVTYNDLSPAHTSTATAIVDSSGPEITNVMVTDLTNAYAKITWDTDEPSTSKVYYGTTPALELDPVEVTALMVDHEVELIGLSTDTFYYYDVESSDMFGHMTRDTNGGWHYTFQTTEKAELLVVYGDATFDREEYYRSALDAKGWSYNEWYAEAQGDPPLPTLQEYKAVLWQTGYEQYPPFEDSQRTLITDYLDDGGRLFVTSHDVAWAFGDDDASGWYNTERDYWVRGTLKARYQIDPRSFTCVEGVSGNTISQDYAGSCPSPGLPYQPHRSGAAGDEVWLEQSGGLTLNVFSAGGAIDYGGETDPDVSDFIAIQWVSSSPNGTSGVGVWGGFPSKVVAFFFEFTRINAATANDFQREDLLDKVITWLIGHDHPDVQVAFPNGGETFDGTVPVTISWSAMTYDSAILNQSIYYSDNAGQSWNHEADVGPIATTYDWNVSTLPNGNKYMVKVVVQDDGSPNLNGSDISDNTFSIVRSDGDLEGPLTIPGSIKVQPNYAETTSPVWFNATIDDSNRGNSPIEVAEYFIQCEQPGIAQYGEGTNLSASDGTYDTPLEDVTWTSIYVNTSGWYTLWIHGQDDKDNWGPFESTKFLLLDGINPVDLIPPTPPPNVKISLEGASLENLNITWDKSPEDDNDPTNVDYYDIFFSTYFASGGSGYEKLASIKADASPSYYHVDSLRGIGDPSSYFYMVTGRDQSCNYGVNETQVAKYTRALSVGPNLISIPLIMEDESIETVLQSALPEINSAWTYNPNDVLDPWKSYNPSKDVNDLTIVNHTIGLWIRALASTNVVVVGTVPDSTTISLQTGWNLVGYPSFIWRSVTEALSSVGPYLVEAFDMTNPPEYLKPYSGSDTMMTGDGYWIKVDAPTAFSLQN